MSFHILGIGTAVPAHSIAQSDAMEFAKAFCTESPEAERLLPALYRRCGVNRRHSVLLEPDSSVAAHQRRESHREISRHSRSAAGIDSTTLCDASPVTQSFYEPSNGPDDCGPTTAQRMQVYDRHAGNLGVQAAADALSEAGLSPQDVTHLVTVSCTGFQAPGIDHQIIRDLGLPSGTSRTHLGFMGCHGALNALRVARAYTENDPQACVLIVAVELCSIHHQYGWQPDRIVANALFADGAAAVVGVSDCRAATDDGWRLIANGSKVLEDSADVMEWRVTDHGFEMTLSPQVPLLIQQSLGPWLAGWLATHGLTIGDVGSWAVHPGGPRILSACAQAAGIDPAHLKPSRRILADYGNMSSPTVLFILKQLICDEAAGPCVMLAFGPGLTIEAALMIRR